MKGDGTPRRSVPLSEREADNADIRRFKRQMAGMLVVKYFSGQASPLLSSQRVLEALFHAAVVVCEADADRAFYHTVAAIQLGNQQVLFLHSHNKQSIKQVVHLLREAAIPCGAVVDIDILNSSDDLGGILSALSPMRDNQPILLKREVVAAAVDNREESEVLEELISQLEIFEGELRTRQHSYSGARGALNRIQKTFSNWSDVKK